MLLLAGCAPAERTPPKPRRIVLVPVGPVPADVLAHLQRELPPILNREIVIAAAIPRPEAAFDKARTQYRGDGILAELARHDVPDAERVIGILDADAYAPGLNFIFGQARLPGRFAFVSLTRLRDSFRGQPDDVPRFLERTTKETVHELGHTYGFKHCPNATCVMHFSNSLGDTDRKSARFCGREELPE